MPRPQEDSEFEAFQRTGEPERLGRVFDLCAPRLLLIAFHLARNTPDAEDLVQATFVAAIESAARYDASQPLLQWLAGILANHARMARRRASRVIDPQRVRTDEAPAADALLEVRELAQSVNRALAELPELYRSVLVLRLLHGLKPKQIAHALGRAPDAVRTQLHRGLEQLREALPRSLTLPAGFLLGEDGNGLARVRAVVLGKASGVAVPVVVAAMGGTLMAKKLVVAGVVVLAGVLAYAGWLGLGASAAESSAAPSAPVAEATRPALERIAASLVGSRPERRMDGSRLATGPDTRLARLSGRCIAAATGLPLAGCKIQLKGSPRGGGSGGGWPQPMPMTTADDGRFALSFDPPSTYRFEVEAVADGGATLRAEWQEWAPGTALDVGDVRIPGVAGVRGRVVDRSDQPVAKVLLGAQGPVLSFGSESGAASYNSSRSSDQGTFDLGLLPPGVHRLEIESEHALVAPASLTTDPGRAVTDLLVRVLRPEELPELRGMVVDEAGRPLAGVEVSATQWRPDGSGGRGVGRAVSGSGGEFVLRGRTGSPSAVTLALASVGVPMLDWQPGGHSQFAWGSRDLRLVVARKAVQTSGAVLNVVGPDGEPLEKFRLFLCPDRSRPPWSYSSADERRLPLSHHPRGRIELRDLRPRPWLAIVYPGDEALPPSGPVLFEVMPEGVVDVRVEIRTGAPLPVRVVRPDRSPVGDTRVELLHAFGPKPASLQSPVMKYERADLTDYFMAISADLALLRDTATTDAQGIAVLHGPLGARDLTVRVAPVECLGGLRTGVEITGSETPVEIVVTGGAVLMGRVEPVALAAILAHGAQPRGGGPGVAEDVARRRLDTGLRLQRAGGGFLPSGSAPCPVTADGTFRITGIPADTWDVMLLWRSPVEGSTSGVFGPLATVSLSDGEVRTLVLDATKYQPASLRGRLLLDGKPMGGVACWLGAGGVHGFRVGAPAADPDGWFSIPAVIPADYRLVVALPDPDRREVLVTAPDLLRVGAGETLERTFQLTRQRLLVKVVASDGTTPLAQRTITWSTKLGNMYPAGEFTTDADGIARVDPAPPLPVTLTFRDGGAALGTIEPVAGQQEIRVTLRAPMPAR